MNEFDLKVENTEQLVKLLNNLMPSIRKKATKDGFRAGQKIINQQAKANLYASKKGKSKTGYKYYSRLFKTANLRSRTPDEFRLKLGVENKEHGYKLRWLEWGTSERSFFKKKVEYKTGSVKATNFFYKAVKDKREEAQKVVSEAILDSIKKNAEKYGQK